MQNVENLSPQIIRRVAKEMAELITQTPEGIRVILNEADVTDIQAVIEGPGKIVPLACPLAFTLLGLDETDLPPSKVSFYRPYI